MANSFFPKTLQFTASSKGQAQALPLLTFIHFNSGHSSRSARSLYALFCQTKARATFGVVGVSSPSIILVAHKPTEGGSLNLFLA
jgi:hypothetical protein